MNVRNQSAYPAYQRPSVSFVRPKPDVAAFTFKNPCHRQQTPAIVADSICHLTAITAGCHELAGAEIEDAAVQRSCATTAPAE